MQAAIGVQLTSAAYTKPPETRSLRTVGNHRIMRVAMLARPGSLLSHQRAAPFVAAFDDWHEKVDALTRSRSGSPPTWSRSYPPLKASRQFFASRRCCCFSRRSAKASHRWQLGLACEHFAAMCGVGFLLPASASTGSPATACASRDRSRAHSAIRLATVKGREVH